MAAMTSSSTHAVPNLFAKQPTDYGGVARTVLRRVDAWFARPRSAQFMVLALALYLVAVANVSLWSDIARLGGAPSLYWRTALGMAVLITAASVALLSATAWTRGMKPVWLIVVLIAAFTQYFMLTYRMVMDPSMALNVLHTDAKEAGNLLGWRMLPSVLAVMALPTWWIVRVRLAPMRPLRQIGRNLALLVLALVVAAGSVMAFSRDLAPLMRNNPVLRYQINPLASLYSTSVAVLRPLLERKRLLLPMSAGVALGVTHATGSKPPLLVLVAGETVRADHFGLNGYDRDTTAQLAARKVFNWSQVRSCGTSTNASLPCMFSPLGKEAFEARKDDYENLLDVVQASGMAVLWLENQSGCKGVCDRVPTAEPQATLPPEVRKALCEGGECQDEAMLYQLSERLATLPQAQRERGVLLVMHQMGSHGPAYWKRSSSAHKRFLPECRTEVLAECSHAELMNAYDNSIAETDTFLGKTMDWAKAQSGQFDPGVLYLSDHGESLGEYGLFLHGLPYSVAPDDQKHVPMVAWLSPALMARDGLTDACLRASADTPLSHDNLYHWVLGLLDLSAPSYQRGLDPLAPCRIRVSG